MNPPPNQMFWFNDSLIPRTSLKKNCQLKCPVFMLNITVTLTFFYYIYYDFQPTGLFVHALVFPLPSVFLIWLLKIGQIHFAGVANMQTTTTTTFLIDGSVLIYDAQPKHCSFAARLRGPSFRLLPQPITHRRVNGLQTHLFCQLVCGG